MEVFIFSEPFNHLPDTHVISAVDSHINLSKKGVSSGGLSYHSHPLHIHLYDTHILFLVL